MIFKWNKGTDVPLSRNFSSSEFECPCNMCLENQIDLELVIKLQILRDKYGVPMKITSGFRCDDYQQALKQRGYKTSKKRSQHQEGKAADFQMKGIDLNNSYHEAHIGKVFMAIGMASNFVHVDLRMDKKRRWGY